MIRGFCWTASIVLILSISTSASAQVTLKMKYPEGRKATSEVTTKTKQTLSLAGMDLGSGSEQTITVTTVNGKRANDGTLEVKSKIEAVKAELSLPGGIELEFDSEDPDADPPGTQFDVILDIFKATAKSTWTVVMDKDNRVVEIKDRDAAFKDLPQALQDAMQAQLDPEYLKTAANDELDKLPSGPVSQGDSWERTNTVRLDSGQKLTFTNKYTYAGEIARDGKKYARIDTVTTEVDYSADATSPLKVLESDLKVAESKGAILFDMEDGQIVRSQSKVQLKGTLKLEVMGMELPGTLDLTMENSVKLK